jgi:hypothetical protein
VTKPQAQSHRRRAARPALGRLRRLISFLRWPLPAQGGRDPYGPLSVGALIEQLRRFDPDMRVIMPGDVEDWTDVYEAHLDIFSPQRRYPQILELADDGDPKAILVVRLFGAPDLD